MKTRQVIEYDVRTLDEHGEIADVDSFSVGDGRVRNGANLKRRAIQSARLIVGWGGGTAVVERVVYTVDEDGDVIGVPTYEAVWSGGDRARIDASGLVKNSEGGAA